jgi:hypothetical protein
LFLVPSPPSPNAPRGTFQKKLFLFDRGLGEGRDKEERNKDPPSQRRQKKSLKEPSRGLIKISTCWVYSMTEGEGGITAIGRCTLVFLGVSQALKKLGCTVKPNSNVKDL